MQVQSKTPEISVVVPVRNGARALPALMASLSSQTLDRDRFEVIVVDNDSSDATPHVAHAYGATVVHEPIPNRSRARNRGAAEARSALYAFTDADCVADPRWLETLLDSAELAPLVAGDVALRVRDQPNAIERFEALWRFGQEAWVNQGWAATANLLVHAHAFRAIGGFDVTWRHIGEDVDFCIRAGRAGYRLAYSAKARVEHQAEHHLRPFLRRCFLHGYAVNQTFYRLGLGYRAWRSPGGALFGARALHQLGYTPESFDPADWREMVHVARLYYLARVAGSIWGELLRAR